MFNEKVVNLAKEDRLNELLNGKVTGEMFLFYEALIIGEHKTVVQYNFNEMGASLIERLVMEFEISLEVSSSSQDVIEKIIAGRMSEIVTNRGNKKCMTAKKILGVIIEITNALFERNDIVDSYEGEENIFIGYSIRSGR